MQGQPVRNQTLTVATLPLAGALLLLTPQVEAKTETVNYQVELTVTRGSCTLTGAATQTVDFKTVILQNVSGNNYSQPLPLNFSCGSAPKKLYITFSGKEGWNNRVIASDLTNLGVQIKNSKDSTVVTLNKELAISGAVLPTYNAVLVINGTNTVANGSFTATTTVKVDYE